MDEEFHVDLARVQGFRFDASFPGKGYDPIKLDEPTPLGTDEAPNAARMLAAAVGNCLAASLLLCLERSRVDVKDVKAHVTGRLARNAQGRWRIQGLDVTLQAPGVPADKLARCRALFEEYCIVTQSVRAGLTVNVTVDGA